MLRILIVDDEVLERKALTKIINGSSSTGEVEVVGEAPNGRKAIEMAKEHKPDIIFMDIKMPGIDGVQAVKEIKKFDTEIRFIMVSAFNTFEYAKEVMQQGVKEYILKPSRKQDILASLERVSSEILEFRKDRDEQLSLKENFDRAVSIAQKEWVTSLIMNQVQDFTFDEWGRLLGMEINSGYIMMFLFQERKGIDFSQNDKQNWYRWLTNAIKSSVKKQEVMIGPMTESQVPVLFLCQKTEKKIQFKSDALAIIESVNHLFQKESFKGELKIGVGLPYQHAHELNQSYHDAILALKQLPKTPNRRYLFCDKQASAKTPLLINALEMEKQLLDAIRQGDINQVLHTFDSLVMRYGDRVTASIVKKSFDELFVLISRMLHELGIEDREIPVIQEVDEVPRMLEKGKAYLLEICGRVQVWRNHHAKGMLQKAKEYIEIRYAELLTLEQVAEYVDISPFYFSKLFKDRFGMTFIDYLTEIRIKQAKAEMLDHGKSLKEICYSVGYRDPNYFSRVFKKHTGLTPKEYRKSEVTE